ncbi:MAG TPA: hypothetical protein VGB53_08720 [Rubricoccaceae bacterium]|jgi:hypothetical protein
MSPAVSAAVFLALVATPAAAQGVAQSAETPTLIGEVGTWELAAAENTPGDDILVFTRMTFTGRDLTTTAVYLDPDDAELSARITTDSYTTANGQLLVRAPGSTTVLDVSRATDDLGTEALVVQDLRTGVRLTLHPADPAGALDPALVGAWAGADRTHTWAFRFEPDGRAFVRRDDQDSDHEEAYTVAGPYLLVDEDAYHFTLSADRLMLTGEGDTIELSRAAHEALLPPR